MNNKRSLVKIDSSVVLKGDKLLALTTKTLAPYYIELREWWNNLNDTWKYDLLKILSNEDKYRGKNGEIRYVPQNYELEKIILTNKLEISEGKRNLDPVSRFQNLVYLKGSDQRQLLDIWGLEKLNSLIIIILQHLEISDLSPLSNLVNLKFLNILNSKIKNLAPIAFCHRLENLTLAFCKNIEDISPLASLHNLVSLNCFFMGITNSETFNFTPLRNLNNLKKIDFGGIIIDNLDFITNLQNLESLSLAFAGVGKGFPNNAYQVLMKEKFAYKIHADLDSIRNLKKIRSIFINGTNITNIEGLYELPNLEYVNVSNTAIPESQIKHLSKINSKCTIVIEDRTHEDGTYNYYKNSEIYLKDKSNNERQLK